MITLNKLVFDTANPTETANVGAYLRDASGNILTSTLLSGKQSLDVNIAGSSGLGIFAEDSAHTSGDLGQLGFAVRHDANTSLVDTDGDYAPLQVDALGYLKVSAKVTVDPSDAEYAEDSASANADVGLFVLNVRQDTLSALVSANGDYAAFKSDALGRLYTQQAAQSGAYSNKSVTTTAAKVITTPLTNRTRVTIQNIGNKDMYIGFDASVTTSTGTRIAVGASWSEELGPQVDVYGLTAASTTDARCLEVA